MGAKKAPKKKTDTRERLPSPSPDYSSSSDSLLSETSPRFVLVLRKYVFFISFCPLLTAASCASLNPHCDTYSLVCFCFGESRRFPFVFPIVDHG